MKYGIGRCTLEVIKFDFGSYTTINSTLRESDYAVKIPTVDYFCQQSNI